jgi:gliding motility-associated lipoprotein GldB
MKKCLIPFCLLLFLWGCGKKEEEKCVFKPDVSPVKIDFSFEQFQDSLTGITSRQELVALLGRQPMLRDYILRRREYPDDSVFVKELYMRFTNPHIDTLLSETKRVFGDLSDLKAQFSEAFGNLKYYYPQFKVPKVKTVISGLDTDLLVTDSVIIVSLDFYLGKNAKYRPKMYEYLLRRYEPEDVVPSCMMIYGIDSDLNKTNLNDKTVLADMISYGKSFYFARHMLPCTADSVLLWYTSEEMKGAKANEDLIWARFIQDKVLFSTNMIDKRNYLSERPATIQVGEKCPGRIGQWVGWQIVKSYMNSHKEVTLPQLMEMSDAQKLFKESGYKPQNR